MKGPHLYVTRTAANGYIEATGRKGYEGARYDLTVALIMLLDAGHVDRASAAREGTAVLLDVPPSGSAPASRVRAILVRSGPLLLVTQVTRVAG